MTPALDMSKPKVAYQVSEEMDGQAVVVFDSHGLSARRRGACELGTDFESVTCSRAKHFDEFASKGFVPMEELIAAGWWYECYGCGDRVTDETEGVLIVENSIYCSEDCRLADLLERKKRADLAHEFRMKVHTLVPSFAVVSKVEATGTPQRAWFRYPGQKFTAHVDMDKDGNLTTWVSNGDSETFAALKEKEKQEAK